MDNTEYIEIRLSCYSEYEDISIECGIDYKDKNVKIDLENVEWIFVGLGESFWENHYEFEAGINKAKVLMVQNQSLSLRQALRAVFGHFTGTFFVNGEEKELDYDIDFDDLLYNLLSV